MGDLEVGANTGRSYLVRECSRSMSDLEVGMKTGGNRLVRECSRSMSKLQVGAKTGRSRRVRERSRSKKENYKDSCQRLLIGQVRKGMITDVWPQ